MMLHYIPMLALLVVGSSSLLRGVSVKRQTGQRAWAFGSAKGWQRVVGIGFALCAVTLVIAAAVAARYQPPNQAAAILGAALCVLGTLILVIAQIQMGHSTFGIDAQRGLVLRDGSVSVPALVEKFAQV